MNPNAILKKYPNNLQEERENKTEKQKMAAKSKKKNKITNLRTVMPIITSNVNGLNAEIK